MKVTLILVCLLQVVYSQRISDPCFSYKELDSTDDYARSVANSATISRCDNTLDPGWYRVTSKAGERMPTECIIGGTRCGTMYPIWTNGTYPTNGQVNTITACAANFNGDCCSYSYNIQVKNCTNYLVYNLVPVAPCYQAYCFGSELPCPEGETSDNGFSPGCEADLCHSNHYEILKGEMKRSSNYTLNGNDVAIEDSRLTTGWYRIDSVTGNDIVNTSVRMMQCGTLYPLWMKGNVPTQKEKTVNRKMCRSGLYSNCDEEYDVKVRNCGDYRTYYLPQLNVDKSAYCFGTLPVPVSTTTKSTTTTPAPTTTLPTTQRPTRRTRPSVRPTDGTHHHDDNRKPSKKNDKEDRGILIVVGILAVLVLILASALLILCFYKSRTASKRSVSCSSLQPPSYDVATENDCNKQKLDLDREGMGYSFHVVEGISIGPRTTVLEKY